MSDNGKEEQIPRDELIQKEQPKTKEQFAEERLERYKNNPEAFTENSELIVAVKKDADKNDYAFIINPNTSRVILWFAAGEIAHRISVLLINRDTHAHLTQQKIVTPGPGTRTGQGRIMNFVRRGKRN